MHERWAGNLPTWKHDGGFAGAEVLAMATGRYLSCNEALRALDKQRRILVTYRYRGGRDKGADAVQTPT
jgi:hypothetical protein